jgi:CRP/FNR family cyclic AMP-dependent transcriptional regulator
VDAALRRAAIFHGVEPRTARAMAGQLQRLNFPSGHTVFREGEPGERLYIVLAGKVKITCRSTNDREAILAVIGPSEMFGELSVFDPGPRTSNAVTLTKVRAVTVDRAALRSWIADHPQSREQLLAALARRLRRTNDHLYDLIFTDVAGRVAKQLLALGQRFGTQKGAGLRVSHGLTQEELAALVGSTRASVNRALADFARHGWIRVEDNSIVILDADRLAHRGRYASAIGAG